MSAAGPNECPSGAEYATYESRWYAVRGDTIRESKGDVYSDKAYRRLRLQPAN